MPPRKKSTLSPEQDVEAPKPAKVSLRGVAKTRDNCTADAWAAHTGVGTKVCVSTDCETVIKDEKNAAYNSELVFD